MKLETEIECPTCRRKIKIKVEEMVPSKSKICNWCKTEIEFRNLCSSTMISFQF